MARNPSASILFANGQLRPINDTADSIVIKLGASSEGPYLRPSYVSQRGGVASLLGIGPLARSAAFHCDYSGPCYVLRCRSTPGTKSAVTKTAATGGSVGTCTVAYTSYTLHPTVTPIGALNITTGWVTPGVPLPMVITSGAGTVAHTQTVTYVNEAGDTTSETLSISAAGTVSTVGDVARVISVTSNINPVGSQGYSSTWAGPADRYDELRILCTVGGVIGVSGGTLPRVQVSLDNGRTYSRTIPLPSTGILPIQTYAGGVPAEDTGLTATISGGSPGSTVYGAVRAAGATTLGDIVYSMLASGVSITHTVGAGDATRSVAVVGSAVTVTPARTGGVVDGTETAAAISTYILTSSDAGPVAARALLYPRPVGAGSGILAAVATTTAANGGVAYTPKVEGWRVTQAASGTPSTATISVGVDSVARLITVTTATDSNGASVSTATEVETAVNASALASPVVIADATGTGAGLAGYSGPYALPVSVATGDVFSLTTTPPSVGLVDLQEAIASLTANDTALSQFSVVHLVGEGATSSILATLESACVGWANAKRQYKTGLVEAAYQGSTAESTWVQSVLDAYPTKGQWVGVAAGECNYQDSLTGTIDRASVGTAYISRLMICPIAELPSHTDCDTTQGILTSLSGVLVRNALATDPPLWQSDDALVTLNASNFVTLRTWPGRTGIYVRQGLVYTAEGDDYEFITNRRVANVAADTSYVTIVSFVNSNQPVDLATGRLSEQAAQKIEAAVSAAIRQRLLGGGRQSISGFAVRLDRTVDFAATGEILIQLTIVPLFAVQSIQLTIGYSQTL